MTVLIDAKELRARATGLARYEREIAARVSKHSDTVLVIRRQTLHDGSAAMLSGRRVIVPNCWPSVVIEQLVMPLLSWRHRATVIHALASRLPLIARHGRRVVTFHEDRKSYYDRYPAVGLYSRWAARVQLYVERWSVARADTVLAISSVSAAAAISLGAEQTRVKVAHHGVSDAFHPNRNRPFISDGPSRSDEIPLPEVLIVASGDPRDDLDYVLQAVRPLRERLSVTVVGRVPKSSTGPYLRLASSQGIRLRFIGEVSDEQLAALYSHCLSYVHPSTFEGFGLAVVEAMACGAPIIARPSPALIEVADQHATLAPDPADATFALRELLDIPEKRTALSAAGRQRAMRFDWDIATELTLAAYQ